MRRTLQGLTLLSAIILFSIAGGKINAQTLEWRLVSPTYSAVDPDGAGPATGSATFKLQIHTISGSANNINTISTGWSYQLTKAMVPTGAAGPGCPAIVSNPTNVVVSPAFAAAGFAYTTVNQCNVFAQTTGGQVFDTRAVGTLDGTGINIGTTWIDVFTVTLWSLSASAPEAGYVIINSGSGGTPGAFSSYAVADADANEYPVNSLTYATPLGLGSGVFPITLSGFNINCSGGGPKLNWQTMSEVNSSHFEIERSENGATAWTSVGSYKATGNSSARKDYEFVDLKGSGGFYRLKQVDKDGKFTYSPVQRANCQTKQSDLFVYPVPARDVLNVVVGTDRNDKASVLLVDVSGRIIRRLNTDLLKGTNNIRFNVAGLTAGEYFLRVVGSEVVKTQKVTIVK